MSELSTLQELVLQILESNADRSLFGGAKCLLKNKEIFKKIEDVKMRPSSIDYISVVLTDLEKKGKVKKESKYLPGYQGIKRVITIL